MKIYGKIVERAFRNSDGKEGGLMNRCLKIYEIKSGLKGVLSTPE